MKKKTELLFADFISLLHKRMEAGELQYGDSSYERPLEELLNELQQEAVDIAGWGIFVWAKAKRLEELVKKRKEKGR